jgi:uncharacterized protein YcnI
MSKLIALAAVAAGTLVVAAPGWAHVTLQPNEVPADGFTRLDVRVPSERDDADTTRVRVKFPPGFLFISHEPVEGWSVEVKKRKLRKPAEAFGEKISEEVDVVEITADAGVGIGPGQFRDFGLSVKMPNRPGAELAFKALQTYDNGEVVRWIGPPDADEPAPRVTLAPAEEEGGHAAEAAEEEPAAAEDEDDDGGDDDGPSTGLVIAALVLGALGLAAGLAGLTAARRGRRA